MWLGLVAAFLPSIPLSGPLPWYLLAPGLLGYALILWSLGTLGTKFGIAPADRGLTAQGPYRFIRHPLYSSLLALVWCAYLKEPTKIGSILLAVSATGFLIATSMAEERENLVRFGAAYAAYMKRTRRFMPFVF